MAKYRQPQVILNSAWHCFPTAPGAQAGRRAGGQGRRGSWSADKSLGLSVHLLWNEGCKKFPFPACLRGSCSVRYNSVWEIAWKLNSATYRSFFWEETGRWCLLTLSSFDKCVMCYSTCAWCFTVPQGRFVIIQLTIPVWSVSFPYGQALCFIRLFCNPLQEQCQ